MQTIAAGSHRSFARSPGHHAGREGRVRGQGERTRNPNCLGHRAANDNQRRQVSHEAVFPCMFCPCSTSGGGFDLGATGLLRSSHSCWTSGLTIILVSPKVLHPEHASDCAAYIGKVEHHTQQDLGGCDGRAVLLRSWTRQRRGRRQGRCSNTWSLRAHAPWILDF